MQRTHLISGLLALLIFFSHASQVYAGPHDVEPVSYAERRAKMKAMSPEEREAFFKERKKQWDAMTKEQKLTFIEKRRAERLAHMEQRWNQKTDDEKIAFIEKRMERHRRGLYGHDRDTPKAP